MRPWLYNPTMQPVRKSYRKYLEFCWQTASVLIFVGINLQLGYYLVLQAPHGMQIAWLIPTVFLAWLSADWVSGWVHWLADTYGTEHTFILGPLFVESFRRHHLYPQEIVGHKFLQAHADSCLISLLVLVPARSLLIGSEHLLPWLVSWYAMSLSLFVLMTTQIHQWAHSKNPPNYVLFLQKKGFILSSEEHAKHHKPPYRQAYCITCGWFNPWLDRYRVYDRMGTLLKWALSLTPHDDTKHKRLE
jgi:plasmanylethanolamine desaturase